MARRSSKFEQLDPGDVRHPDVGDDYVVRLGLNFRLGHRSARNRLDGVAVLAEGDFQQLADGLLVVNNEESGHGIILG